MIDKWSENFTWLVCKTCGEKELVQEHTEFLHCKKCAEPRYAETDSGVPMVVFSDIAALDFAHVSSERLELTHEQGDRLARLLERNDPNDFEEIAKLLGQSSP